MLILWKKCFKSGKIFFFSRKRLHCFPSTGYIIELIRLYRAARSRLRISLTRISPRQHVTTTWCEHVRFARLRVNNTSRVPRETHWQFTDAFHAVWLACVKLNMSISMYLTHNCHPLPFPAITLISFVLHKFKLSISLSH